MARDPCLFPQVVMEEDGGNKKGVKEEGEEENDEENDANIWVFWGLPEVLPRKLAVRVIYQREIGGVDIGREGHSKAPYPLQYPQMNCNSMLVHIQLMCTCVSRIKENLLLTQNLILSRFPPSDVTELRSWCLLHSLELLLVSDSIELSAICLNESHWPIKPLRENSELWNEAKQGSNLATKWWLMSHWHQQPYSALSGQPHY